MSTGDRLNGNLRVATSCTPHAVSPIRYEVWVTAIEWGANTAYKTREIEITHSVARWIRRPRSPTGAVRLPMMALDESLRMPGSRDTQRLLFKGVPDAVFCVKPSNLIRWRSVQTGLSLREKSHSMMRFCAKQSWVVARFEERFRVQALACCFSTRNLEEQAKA
jgi:hypothetical protein